MDPISADQSNDAFLEFNISEDGKVAVFCGEGGAFCSGLDLEFASILNLNNPLNDLDIEINDEVSQNGKLMPRGGPMVLSRLQLKKSVIGAIAGPLLDRGMELAL